MSNQVYVYVETHFLFYIKYVFVIDLKSANHPLKILRANHERPEERAQKTQSIGKAN